MNFSKELYKHNKKRNTVVIFAVALTCFLFTVLFTMFSGLNNNIIETEHRMAGNKGDIAYKYLSREQFDIITKHPYIKNYDSMVNIGDLGNEETKTLNVGVLCNPEETNLTYFELIEGSYPQEIDEVVLDEDVMKLLGDDLGVGSKVELYIKQPYSQVETSVPAITQEFTITGVVSVPSDGVFGNVVYVSERFYYNNFYDYGQHYATDGIGAGSIRLYIDLIDGVDSNLALEEIARATSYNNVSWIGEIENENDIYGKVVVEYNKNSVQNILGYAFGIFVIMLFGYLIIHNCISYNVRNDSEIYAQIRLIGGDKKFITNTLLYQGLRFLIFGVPIGMLLGYVISVQVYPHIIDMMSLNVVSGYLKINYSVYIFVIIFTVLTVAVSLYKPIRLAYKLSPIESKNNIYVSKKKKSKKSKKTKRTKNGQKLYRIALSNTFRYKKMVFSSALSVVISIIVINFCLVFNNSLSVEKFVDGFLDTDFVMAHLETFRGNYLANGVDGDFSFDENFKTEIENTELVEGGAMYTLGTVDDINMYGISANGQYRNPTWLGDRTVLYEYNENNAIPTTLYGVDDFIIENEKKYTIVDGEFNPQEYSTGEYVVITEFYEGLDTTGDLVFKAGDTITLKTVEQADFEKNPIEQVFSGSKDYKVMCVVRETRLTSGRMPTFEVYVPESELANYGEVQNYEYTFNVIGGEENKDKFDEFLQTAIDTKYNDMSYASYKTYTKMFNDLTRMTTIICISIAIITLAIGIMNLILSMNASLEARRKEVAMFRCIGFTKEDLKLSLLLESFYYGLTIFVLYILINNILVRPIIISYLSMMEYSQYTPVAYLNVVVFVCIMVSTQIIMLFTSRKILNLNILDELGK